MKGHKLLVTSPSSQLLSLIDPTPSSKDDPRFYFSKRIMNRLQPERDFLGSVFDGEPMILSVLPRMFFRESGLRAVTAGFHRAENRWFVEPNCGRAADPGRY
jgi:hypothetical protein